MIWVKRILIGLIVVAALAFLAFNLFKTQIATRAFDRAIDQNAGVDRSAALPDGLHVYMCGTGSPMPDPARAGPCIGVLAGDKVFVFDVGAGSPRNLGAMGFPTARLQNVYLTHLHSDHIDGLGELLLNSWIGGSRSTPTPIIGPVGTQDVVAGFNAVYRIDSTYRVAHHGTGVANPDGFGGVATEIETPSAPDGQLVVLDEGDLKITAIRVDHAPIEPAFGYRIDYKDRSISISGDTVYHTGFISASEGVDLMFHEALNRDMVAKIGTKLGERGAANGAKIFADILDYHTSPEEAARAAQEAGAGQLVLYHIVPQLPVEMLEPVFLGDAKSEFDGPITVGQDGMIFSLPAGSDKVERSKAL
ncbi:MAG: MBL fold metallo-hydrolase [Hyphomonadaceae bacterium]